MSSELIETLQMAKNEGSYSSYLKAASFLKKNPQNNNKDVIKIAVLRNFTVEPLLPVLEVELALSSLLSDFYIGDYDNIFSEVTQESSPLYSFQPDFIILAQWLETISPILTKRFLSLSKQKIEDEVERIHGLILTQVSSIRRNTGAALILNTFPLPALTTLGIFEYQSETFLKKTIEKINSKITDIQKSFPNVLIVDYNAIIYNLGYQNAIDFRGWQTSRSPIGSSALVPLARNYARVVSALRGKTKKCLILDCDNTLWGGIIGEDGISGIKLGPDFPGSSFLDFQLEIMNLHDRGVILALCSKNNEEDVLEVFRSHPFMQIKEDSIATWQINWIDKVSNIRQIASTLNIGLDSLVFVDDSPYECSLVREHLPEVEVIQLSGKPSLYRNELLKHGYFDSLSYTEEDRQKNLQYRVEEKRNSLQLSTESMASFLQSLDLVATVGKPTNFEIPRIAQLTQKTNQFNLTTRRYTEDDIKFFSESSDWDVFFVKLKDKFSDMGLIAVAIVNYKNSETSIDSFLMSCRVIGRGVEDVLLSHVVQESIKRKIGFVSASYNPSNKNAQVKDFYKTKGFKVVAESNEETQYRIATKDFSTLNIDHIKLTHA